MKRLLEKLFASEKYYEYQNLAARRSLYGDASYTAITTTEDECEILHGDFLLDQMDVLWYKMNWVERMLLNRTTY